MSDYKLKISDSSADPKGHDLLDRRLALIPQIIADMLGTAPPPLSPASLALQRCIITGTGSSEAHARYLAHLLNFHTAASATYLPLSGFTSENRPAFHDKTLILFSQGLSPNAQLALRHASAFAHTILFTAATPAVARQAGKPERAAQLEAFLSSGGELLTFPLAEEYTTLIRLVGPLAGYLRCLQFAAALPGSRIQLPTTPSLASLLATPAPPALLAAIRHNPESFARGLQLIAASPTSDFAQNLACKFVEGLFWPAPAVSDFLQFAHGPFQQCTARPHPVIILRGDSPMENELVPRATRMLVDAGQTPFELSVSAPPLLAIFAFEMALNRLVLALLRELAIDQINWPGRGRDDLLYGFCPDVANPLASPT